MEDQTIAMPVTNEDFLFSKPPQNSKQNPRSYWKVASKGLTSIAFCPDGVHFAVTSLDGTLKVLNYEKEMLLDVYKSYFAALQCCAWSPDGVYIAAGGQDDLISIFGFRGRLMSRLQGHNSWVNSLAFDETECKDKIYRLVSGGEDNRICFWDFSIASLGRRKVD